MRSRGTTWGTIAGFVTTAVLLVAGLAQGEAVLTKNDFKDDFEDLEAKYWTVDKIWGPLVGPALGRLEVLIPNNSSGSQFWGGVVSRSGFCIKPDSYFDMTVEYKCMVWPKTSGIRAALTAEIYNNKNKWMGKFTVARVSFEESGEGLHIYNSLDGHTYFKNTTRKAGSLVVYRGKHGFLIRAADDDTWLGIDYTPKFPVGKITWKLWVFGFDSSFGNKKVKVGYDDFSIWSEKGFIVPKN